MPEEDGEDKKDFYYGGWQTSWRRGLSVGLEGPCIKSDLSSREHSSAGRDLSGIRRWGW